MMIILVMMMMMSSVFSVIAGGGWFLTLPQEGDECEGKDTNGNYVIDEDLKCVLDACDYGYSKSSSGKKCIVDEIDTDSDTDDDSGADDSGAGAGETCDETLSGEKDAGYRGCQAQTVTGKTCQSWGLQTPHGHKQVLGEKGVEAGHNYCRNPDGEDTIWCYTTDPEKRWEYCDPVGGRVCDETLIGEKDAGYRGCQTQTVTGKTCQRWTSQSPHTHKKVLGEKGVGGHNYCRNPDGEDTIWCYTTDPEKRWEYCDPLV